MKNIIAIMIIGIIVAAVGVAIPTAVFAASDTWAATEGDWSNWGCWSTGWPSYNTPGSTSSTTSTDTAWFPGIGYLDPDTSEWVNVYNVPVNVDYNRNIGFIYAYQHTSYTLTGGSILLSNGGYIAVEAGSATSYFNSPVAIQANGGGWIIYQRG